MDSQTRSWLLIGGVLAILTVATAAGQMLRRRTDSGLNQSIVDDFNHRISVWWLMSSVLGAAFLFGHAVTVVIFGLTSFWALREFITLTPTRPGDHRALFWVFFFFTPLQFLLVGMGRDQYGFYSVLIPVYAFLFIPARVAFSGDHKRFLERTAKIQAGLMICVYCFSYAPAILTLSIPGFEGQNLRLLFFFVVIAQLSDVMQYAWQRLAGKHIIAPTINTNRTWESLIGSVGSSSLVGGILWWATPFNPWQAATMSAIIAITAFAGGMTMSAIKRDRGVKDYGTLVRGHGGVLDRIDSICFSAPIFFHVTRYFFGE